jgi:hypothetical protein
VRGPESALSAEPEAAAEPDPSDDFSDFPQASVQTPIQDRSAQPESELRSVFLLSQRLDVLSERVELLHERLNSVLAAAKVSHGRADAGSMASSPAVASPGVSDRACSMPGRDAAPPGQSRSLGTLRPPPVPSGFGALRGQSALPSVMPDYAPAQSGVAGPIVSGTLPDLCLATLLGLFELERRTGVLTVQAGERSLQLELRDGVVMQCQLDGVPTAAVQGVREAFRWRSGQFAFRRTEVNTDVEAPQPVSALLLEALRQHDEAARAS